MKRILNSTMLAVEALGVSQSEYFTLREAGLANGVSIGYEFNLSHWSDEPYKRIFDQEYANCTAENACKWGAIR